MNALTLPALPAHLANRQVRATAAAMMAAGGSQLPPHLSILGGRFTLVDAAGNEFPVPTFDPVLGPYLDCVIMDINEHKSKQFYGGKKYDPNNTEPPICWSDNGLAPSIGAEQPQAALCSQCPNNVRGSATSQLSGKAIKACSDRLKVAILVPGLPGHVFLFNVSPAGIGNIAAYATAVSKNQGPGRALDPCDLITRLSFEKDSVGVIQFTAVGYIDAATAALEAQLLDQKATDSIVGRDDVPRTGAALPAPAIQPAFIQQLAPPPQPAQQSGPAFAFPGAGMVAGAQPSGQAPFVTPGAPSSAAPAAAWPAQAASPVQTVATTSPSNGGAPAPRKRRTKAEMAAAAAAAGPLPGQAPLPFQAAQGGPAAGQAPVPPFMQGGAPQPSAGQNFGIAPAVAPNAELMASLQNAFKLPTG